MYTYYICIWIIMRLVCRYEGVMKYGKFHGEGSFLFGSLDKYQGEFVEGRSNSFKEILINDS